MSTDKPEVTLQWLDQAATEYATLTLFGVTFDAEGTRTHVDPGMRPELERMALEKLGREALTLFRERALVAGGYRGQTGMVPRTDAEKQAELAAALKDKS